MGVRSSGPLAEALEAVRSEAERGATWAARVVLEALVREVEEGQGVCGDAEAAASAVEAANPSMASLYNVALLVRRACSEGGDAALAGAARRMLFYMSEARERLRQAASEAFPRGTRVATLSYSSAVEAVLLAVRRQLGLVVVFESRPGGEGLSLARVLRGAGVRVTLAPDAAMRAYIGSVDMVLVGADTVTRDGCLVNKVGTRLAALAARDAGAPLVAVFEAFKVHPARGCGEVALARRTFEVEGWGPESYPVFEETPPGLVSGAMTEAGVEAWSPELPPRLHAIFLERVLGG